VVLIDQLGRAYDKETDPSYKSAFALSLGLLNARDKAKQIHQDFQESNDEDFRGYAAVALGFMNYTEAADDLRTFCQSKTIAPTFRLQVATGLGLMSDTEAVSVLITTLKDAQTLGVSSAVAKALGIIGDESAIDPLKEIAFDANVQPITRAFACVALGIVCEKTDLPWNSRISQDNNYRARVPAIDARSRHAADRPGLKGRRPRRKHREAACAAPRFDRAAGRRSIRGCRAPRRWPGRAPGSCCPD
jgi:HEAT repeat protein